MNRLRLRFCFFLAPKKVSKPEIENRPFPLEWLPDTPLLCDIVDIVLFILNLPCRPFFTRRVGFDAAPHPRELATQNENRLPVLFNNLPTIQIRSMQMAQPPKFFCNNTTGRRI